MINFRALGSAMIAFQHGPAPTSWTVSGGGPTSARPGLAPAFTCGSRRLRLSRCSDIELYARALEARGRARATIGRRSSTIAGFYRYAERKA